MKEEILKKVITKAEENGFKNNLGNPDWTYSDKNLGYFANLLEEHIYEAIIFSHDFAKAFWGEEQTPAEAYSSEQCSYLMPAWQYHLQQMVLEENALEYLAKFLKGK